MWIKHPSPDPWALLEPAGYSRYQWREMDAWRARLLDVLRTLVSIKDPVGHRILVMRHAVLLWRYIHWLQEGPLAFTREQAYKEALHYAR